MNELLLSNFGVTLGLAGAINRKMGFVKFVEDRKMNKFRYGTSETKKNVSPYCIMMQAAFEGVVSAFRMTFELCESHYFEVISLERFLRPCLD